MRRALTACIGSVAFGCTYYTDCPNGQINATTCAAADTGKSGGGNPTLIQGDPVPGSWVDSTGSLSGTPSGFGNVCYVVAQPSGGALIAGLSEAGLWSSANGQDWQELGTGASSGSIKNRAGIILFDPLDSTEFWEAGSYGGGVYVTRDNGENFVQVGDFSDAEGLGVDFDDPERALLLATLHERNGILYQSTNGGNDWAALSGPETANTCTFPLILDRENAFLACSQWGGGTGGIFYSADGGETWDLRAPLFAARAPLVASDGTIYWSAEGGGGMVISKDHGLTWSRLANDELKTVHPIELPDGRIATIAARTVVVSRDHGATWRRVTPDLSFDAGGIAYSETARAFLAWQLTSLPEIPSEAIVSFGFDSASE